MANNPGHRNAPAVHAPAPRGRFAPSPTGRMHAGNIFAALMCWLMVRSAGGAVVLRMDDLDVERSRREFADAIMRDFEMLGLTWDEGPYWQQGREEAYREAFRTLEGQGIVYPCFCTRADLRAASAPHRGEKAVYPGTCRSLSADERCRRVLGRSPSWRVAVPHLRYALVDAVQGEYAQTLDRDCGDFVVRRSDGLFAYQLATVVDDADQGVNLVVRGVDLLASTPQQMFLQDALGLPHASYAHVPLIVAERDRRLSKRDRDAGMDELLSRFKTPEGIIGHIAHLAGLIPEDAPSSCDGLLENFDASRLSEIFPDKIQIPWGVSKGRGGLTHGR